MSSPLFASFTIIAFASTMPVGDCDLIGSTAPSTEFKRGYAGVRLLDNTGKFFSATVQGISLLRCGVICFTKRLASCSYFQFTQDVTGSDVSGTCQMGNTPNAQDTAAKSGQVRNDSSSYIYIKETATAKTVSLPSSVITTGSQMRETTFTTKFETFTTPTTSSTASTVPTTATGNWSEFSKQDSLNKPVNENICKSLKSSTDWNCNCTSNTFCQGLLRCEVQFSNGTAYYYLDRKSSAIDRFNADSRCDDLGMNMVMTKTTEAFNVICQILFYAVGTAANESYWMGASRASNSTTWLFDDGTAVSKEMVSVITDDSSSNNNDGDRRSSRSKRSPAGNQNRDSDNRRHVRDHGDGVSGGDVCVVISGDGSNFVLVTRNCTISSDALGSTILYFCALYVQP